MAAATLLYLATGNGVFTVKREGGGDWRVEGQSLTDWAVPKLGVLPDQPNVVYAGTRGDGVWVSEDFGKSWSKPCYGKPGPGKVRCVTVDSSRSKTIYAGAEPIDIFISEDAGKNWARVDSLRKIPWVETVLYPVSTVEPHVRDIALDPKNPGTLYAALQVGFIVKSADGGASWRILNRGLDADVHTIVVNPENTKRLLIATGGHDYRRGVAPGRALYMSEDGGESWTPTATDFAQEYSVPLALHPKNPDVIYSAIANGPPGQWRGRPKGAESLVIRTKDGGRKWEPLNGRLSDTGRSFAEAIAFDESNPDHIYLGLKNGEIYMSEDGGDSWAQLGVKLPSISDMRCVHP